MFGDFARLATGLLVALFHQPIANFILRREHELDSFFRSRGFFFPAPLDESTAHNLYFGLGLFMALFSILRIWSML
ncbi:MAG TPA: hypothetical protein VFQ00_01135 [Terriglobales bacterium]|nr:hypothetical protein [Terriglobales bacterium]